MKNALLCSAAWLAICAPAISATLSTGNGDGDVRVNVDYLGSFGSAVGGAETSDAFYNPVAADGANLPEAGTVYDSFVAVSFDGARVSLSTANLGGEISGSFTETSAERAVSAFSFNNLSVRLEQSVAPTTQDGARVGAVLNQVYRITNTGTEAVSGDLVRYLDGDLQFDGSISDGGGRLELNGVEVLYETDAASGARARSTFVGITATGGQIDPGNRYEVSSYSGLRSKILAGGDLGNNVENDTDSDGFVDAPYDVTLALRNTGTIAPGETLVYTTQTLFGNAVPPRPGSLETLPLLPSSDKAPFVFDIAAVDDQTVFIDPEIATGYTYKIDGAAEFGSVTAPSLASVADPDGYTLSFTNALGDMVRVALGAGEVYRFDTEAQDIRFFTISGISQDLALDPDDPLAFVTGVSFKGVPGSGLVRLTMEPIRTDIGGPAPVPLPAGGLLLMGGMLGLGALRRRSAC